MARPKGEPIWVLRAVVEALHHVQLVEHGGVRGLRDATPLDAALNRARHKWSYGSRDIALLAAAYGFGIARSLPFADGNRRTAFIGMCVFLERNGHTLSADDADIVRTVSALAAGTLRESQLRNWLAKNIKPRSRRVES